MTIKDLDQYKYLKIEIRQCEREIEKCDRYYERTELECFIRGIDYEETRKSMLQKRLERIKQVIIRVREIDAPTGDYLALRVIGNLTKKQIAEKLNVKVNSIKSYRSHAVAILKTIQ